MKISHNWNVKVEKPKGFLQAIKQVIIDRFLSFTMILGIGFLLLVSLVVTALLFSFGKTLIGIYLGNSAVASTFGAAGSLVLLLLWIYYSAQILFFGAEFTQVYANTYGLKIAPAGKVKPLPPEAKESTELRGQPVLPAAAAITDRASQLEEENRQTGRFFFGILIDSFLTGIFTTIFGLKKR